jgi:hypothetical protein
MNALPLAGLASVRDAFASRNSDPKTRMPRHRPPPALCSVRRAGLNFSHDFDHR